MTTLKGPKGTRDFYPREMAVRERLFSSMKATCARYGFEPVDGPMFEPLDLYTRKSGEEVERQLYTFQDKAGRMLALRPEFTPSLARMVAARGQALKLPLRWYSLSRVFRYEKMQKGRLREFFQLNMDILGIDDVSADAEVIAGAVDLMRDLGLDSSDFVVHFSSRKLLEEQFLKAGIAGDVLPKVYGLLDKQSKMPKERFEDELSGLLPDSSIRERMDAVLAARSLEELRRLDPESVSVQELLRLLDYIGDYGIRDFVRFDVGIVRGLAYYTGIVFEIFDRKRSLRAVAGGGRYDHLVQRYGGRPTPAVGFAVGDVVLGEMLSAKYGTGSTAPRSSVYVVSVGEEYPGPAVSLAVRLRAAGISCEYALKRSGVGKQMKLADSARARYVVFTGGEEEAGGVVKVKDMQSGEEREIENNALEEYLGSRLPPH
mgnify:CR=1 FL=1